MQVRIANTNDIISLAQLDKEANLTYWTQEQYLYSLKDKLHNIYILELATGKIVACVVFSLIIDEVDILQFWVNLKYQRCGYGIFLIKYILDECFNVHGAIKIFLEVRKQNIRAIALYKKVGFIIKSLRKDYYLIDGNRYDALCMVCSNK